MSKGVVFLKNENAKIFLSCGQRSAWERELASKVKEKLKELEYDVFVSTDPSEQTVDSVPETLFYKLRNSEYYLFLDFKRESIVCKKKDGSDLSTFRGSVFSHQELAIASLLGIPTILFRDEDVVVEGLLEYLHVNLESPERKFSSNTCAVDICAQIVNAVKDKWDPNWKSELALYSDAPVVLKNLGFTDNNELVADYYQLTIENRHISEIARNCIVCVTSIKNLKSGVLFEPDPLSLKWHAVKTQSINLSPKQKYRFDLLRFVKRKDLPGVITSVGFHINGFIVDYSEAHTPFCLDLKTKYIVELALLSDNLSKRTVVLHLMMGSTVNDVTVEQIKETAKDGV